MYNYEHSVSIPHLDSYTGYRITTSNNLETAEVLNYFFWTEQFTHVNPIIIFLSSQPEVIDDA